MQTYAQIYYIFGKRVAYFQRTESDFAPIQFANNAATSRSCSLENACKTDGLPKLH